MDAGYAIYQVTGQPVDKEQFPSVNQQRNVGGTVNGFVADILNERNQVVFTTGTEPTLEALDERIDKALIALASK